MISPSVVIHSFIGLLVVGDLVSDGFSVLDGDRAGLLAFLCITVPVGIRSDVENGPCTEY